MDISSNIETSDLSQEFARGYEKNSLVSNPSEILSNSYINILTNSDLNLIGTQVKANDDVTLSSSNGDVNIASKEVTNVFDNNTRTGYLKQKETEQLSSDIKADSLHVSANNINIQASKIQADKDINLDAKEKVTVQDAQNEYYFDLKHEVKGSFLGGGKILADTIDKKTAVSSLLKANNVNINSKNTQLIASQILANKAKISADILELISKKDSDYESHIKDKSGLMTRTIESKGHIKEKVVEAKIQTNQLIFNEKDITSQLQTDNLIKTLSSQYNLTNDQIKLVKQIATSKEWHQKTTSLTGMGSLIVGTLVTLVTAGAGGVALAGTSAAEVTTAQAVTSAVTRSLVTGVANQLATAAITGNSFKLDTKSLALGAISSGLTSYANGMIDSSLNLQNVALDKMSPLQQFQRGATNTLVKSTLNSAVYGTDFGDSLKMGLATDVSNLGFREVGDIALDNGLEDGSFSKAILHSVVGGASAELMGGDFQAGALSAGMNELLSPYIKVDAKKSGVTQSRANEIEQAMSGFVGGVSAGAVSGESQINIGSTIAQSATKYNRQLHKDEIKFIEENIKKYAKEKGISPEEAKKILYLGAKYYNNKATTKVIDKILQFNSDTNEQSKYTHQDIKDAYLFLRQESEGMQFKAVDSSTLKNDRFQEYFTSTQSQYEDNSMNVPVMVGGMQDESMILIPGSPIVKTASEAGTVIGKATINIADDIYLKTGIRTENYLQNTVRPSIKAGIKHNKETFEAIGGLSKDGYYTLSNKFLANPTKYTQGGIDAIESYLPGVPTLNYMGLSGWSLDKLYNYEETIKTIDTTVKDLKKIPNKFIGYLKNDNK